MDAGEIRALIEGYAAAWKADDKDAWLATFSTHATQEDPVGEGVRTGHDEIGTFWDGAMASFDAIDIRPRKIHVTNGQAAMEWTIVATDGPEFVVFDGVDVFTFDGDLIASVRAYWERDRRTRTTTPP